MICFICHKKVNKCLVVKGINYGYCEEHASLVQLGVVKLVASGSPEFLEKYVHNYVQSKKSSATIEFEKQLDIEEFLENDNTQDSY